MPPQPSPLFNAVSSSARQLLILLRCLPPSSKAHIQLSSQGLRVSTEEGSAMEAFVFLDKNLFTSYRYNNPRPTADNADDDDDNPIFQVNLNALIETLNIFTFSDVPAPKQSATTEAYAAHRLNRHAGINASSAFGMSGLCTLMYEEEGSPLSIHMSDAGVTITCDLSTYVVSVADEIPFSRESIALKSIIRASAFLDAVTELSALAPTAITIAATPATSKFVGLTLAASGTLGSANVDFQLSTSSEESVLETLHCPNSIAASFRFAHIKSAQRAMQTASKVSLRLDDEGVLSMQFLVELDNNGGNSNVSFVDFKVVPLIDSEAEQADYDDASDLN